MAQKIYITAKVQFANSPETIPINISMNMPSKDSVAYYEIMNSIKADNQEECARHCFLALAAAKTISKDAIKIIPGTVKIITPDKAARLNEDYEKPIAINNPLT